LGIGLGLERSRRGESNSQHRMQLDAVLSKPCLSMREIEEANARNLHLDIALDNLELRCGRCIWKLRGKVLASFLYVAQLG